MADTNYEPEIAQENPFPGEALVADTQGKSSTSGNLTPITSKEKTFPIRAIANELLSTSLNTRSRKILQEFTLEQSGGMQIGKYTGGETGDIRITSNGFTARNKSGENTVAIDGETGDVILQGIIKASGFEVVDELGLVSSIVFDSDSLSNLDSRTTTSGSFVDIDNTTLQFVLERPAKVLIMATVQARIYDSSSTDTTVWEANIPLNIDGTNDGAFMNFIDSFMASQYFSTYTTRIFTMSTQRIKLINEGIHTIKLRMSVTGHTLQIIQSDISYIILGK